MTLEACRRLADRPKASWWRDLSRALIGPVSIEIRPAFLRTRLTGTFLDNVQCKAVLLFHARSAQDCSHRPIRPTLLANHLAHIRSCNMQSEQFAITIGEGLRRCIVGAIN